MKKPLLFLITLCLISVMFFGCDTGIKFTINFESNGGTTCKSIKTNGSKSVRMPKNPTKEGYEFEGWFWDNGIWDEPFTFNSILDKPVSDTMTLTVYAKWERIPVIYDINGSISFEIDGIVYLTSEQIKEAHFRENYDEGTASVDIYFNMADIEKLYNAPENYGKQMEIILSIENEEDRTIKSSFAIIYTGKGDGKVIIAITGLTVSEAQGLTDIISSIIKEK